MDIVLRPSTGEVYLHLSSTDVSQISYIPKEGDMFVLVSPSEFAYKAYIQLDLIFRDRATLERSLDEE